MGSMDSLKNLLNNQFSDGRKKIPVMINEEPWIADAAAIRLFYTGSSAYTTETLAPYYNTTIQVAVRHNLFDKARDIAYQCIERINSNRKDTSTVYFQPVNAPIYLGEDDQQGGYVWGFEVNLKGGK